MLRALQVLSIVLVAVAMAMALAHALELPGKSRLSKETYASVQPIYYPGFTWGGGIGEFGGLVALLALTLLSPPGAAFWLTLAAFLALFAMHVAYWLLTHPVNKFWLEDVELGGFGARFFNLGIGRHADAAAVDWTVLRDRWEYSHVVRAALGLISLALLATAVAI